MSHERFLRLRLLFEEACELPEEGRREYLAERCADDEALALEVERMIAREGFSSGLTKAPLATTWRSAFPAAESWIGRTVGDYHIVRVLGSGGMGTVYEAEQSGVGAGILRSRRASVDPLASSSERRRSSG